MNPPPARPGSSPTLEIAGAAVHCWLSSLDAHAGNTGELVALLDDDERERAARFKFEVHRNRFIVARATLRQLIGLYAGCAPEAVQFGYTAFGKPYLARPHSAGNIRFNISHAESVLICAVTSGREVGVDVERVQPALSVDSLAARYFSDAERSVFFSEDREEARTALFFRLWARKEAVLKALGTGLSVEPDTISVPTAHAIPDPLRVTICGEALLLQDLDAPPDCVAAVAAAGGVMETSAWRWR
jgi:4'-phosphopantetheinyl transferase